MGSIKGITWEIFTYAVSISTKSRQLWFLPSKLVFTKLALAYNSVYSLFRALFAGFPLIKVGILNLKHNTL